MKILIVGASGFLGSNFFIELKKKHDVIGTHFNNKNIENMRKLDIRNKFEVLHLIRNEEPDLILDCDGLTTTDFCEKQKSVAYDINFKGIKNICETANCKVIYFSTDYVFDGQKGSYSETDIPNPINFYGLTKLLAEQRVLSTNLENLVVRVSGLYGLSEINNKFLNAFNEKNIKACIDLFSSPTFIDDLCLNFESLRKYSGIIHFGGPERVNRCEMLKMASKTFGFKCKIIPASYREMNFLARRPRDTSLISNIFNPSKTKIKDALLKMRRELKNEKHNLSKK